MAYGWADLLIGEGFWLGLILIQVILLLVSSNVEYGNLFSAILSTLMFLYYIQNIASNSFENWGVILTGVSIIFHLMIGK